jgi:chromosome segregation ATPase
MAYKLSELEKQLNEADRNTAVLEKNIAASEKLLEELEQSVPRAAEAVSNRFSSVRADREREKQDSAARINELRAEKEKIEKELKKQKEEEISVLQKNLQLEISEVRKNARRETEELNRLLAAGEERFRTKMAELETKIQELRELRRREQLKVQDMENLRGRIRERLKYLLERVNLLIKEEN